MPDNKQDGQVSWADGTPIEEHGTPASEPAPDTRPTKFDLVRYRGENGVQVLCARHDTGLVLGAATNGVLAWGEDPSNAIQRAFLTHEQAVERLKSLCREWAGREDIDFLARDGDLQLVVPKPRKSPLMI